MPRYRMNGRIYSITEEQVERFLTDYPDATEVLDPNEKNLASNKITSPGIEHKNVTPKSTGNTENLTWGQTKILEKDRRKKLKEEEEREAIGANYDVNLELQKADKLFKDVLEMNTDVDLITKLNNLETQKSTSKDLVFFNLTMDRKSLCLLVIRSMKIVLMV